MAKTNQKAAAKRLTELIAVTTDPAMLVQLTKQLRMISPKQRYVKRPRKPVEQKPLENVRGRKQGSILSKVTGSAVDILSDAGKVLHHLVTEIEKSRREHKTRTGQELTETEKSVLHEKLIGDLSTEEVAALEGLETEQLV